MITRTFALALLLSATALAQTIESTIDLTPFGYYNHDVVKVEADGTTATKEWLAVPREAGSFYQVVAQSPTTGGLCFAAAFDPAAGWPGANVRLEKDVPRDALIVRPGLFAGIPWGLQRTVRLNRPPCP